MEEKGKLGVFLPKSLLIPAIAARLLFLLQKSGPAKPFLNCEGKLAVLCEKCRVNRLAFPKHVQFAFVCSNVHINVYFYVYV